MIRSFSAVALRLTLVLKLTTCLAISQEVQIGILTDYESSPSLDSIIGQISFETKRVLGSSTPVSITADNIIYGQAVAAEARSNYHKLSNLVDLVVVIGAVSTHSLARDRFKIPTIALVTNDPLDAELPRVGNTSGVPNFTYLTSRSTLEPALRSFQNVTSIKEVVILSSDGSTKAYQTAAGQKYLNSVSNKLDLKVTTMSLSSDWETLIKNLNGAKIGVFVPLLPSRSLTEVSAIASKLREIGIPTFTESVAYVEAGLLAGEADKDFWDKTKRRLAVTIDDALRNRPLEGMNVEILYENELYVNMAVARYIKLEPSFETLFHATLFNEQEVPPIVYSLRDLSSIALGENLQLGISRMDVSIREKDYILARSSLFPTLDLSVGAVQVNPERTSSLIGVSERTVTGGLVFNQLLFSENAIASLTKASLAVEAQEFDTQSDALEVLLNTSLGFVNVLLRKTDLAIQKENLSNTRRNLEYARSRVSIGQASVAEVYRWESELANASQRVVEARTSLIASKLKLNNVLGNKLQNGFEVDDILIDGDLYSEINSDPIAGQISSPKDLELATEFLIDETLSRHPNKAALMKNIDIASRTFDQNKRLLYLPDLALQAQVSQIFVRDGLASDPPTGSGQLINNTWQVGIVLNFPLFLGLSRLANIEKSEVELGQLALSEKQLDQQLELAVRQNALNVLNTKTNISFGEVSAINAKLNYDLVLRSYRQGAISITQLLDAQQAYISAKIAYAASVYNYVLAQLQLDYSTGEISLFETTEKRKQRQERFKNYLKAR